jgi:F-type H+-transporting ATPase subunit epsilon
MAKVSFRLVMPEREVLATEADMVVVPGSEGDFGVLHGHAPLISTVRPGVLEVLQGNKVEQRFIVVGGFAEVTPERCTVLADEAVPFDEVTAEHLAERLAAIGSRTTAILRDFPLDATASPGGRFADDPPTLEWICFHVLAEYARHAGHLDIVAEQARG